MTLIFSSYWAFKNVFTAIKWTLKGLKDFFGKLIKEKIRDVKDFFERFTPRGRKERQEKRKQFLYSLQYSAFKAYKGTEVFIFSDKVSIPEKSSVPFIDVVLAS